MAAALLAPGRACVVALDEEGGDVTRIEATTGSSLPGNAALGAVDDESLTSAVAAALGARLRRLGVDLDLAPCADVNSDPANPVIGVRSFGADPALVARHTAAFVTGLQSAGVAACAKHFPGHGAPGRLAPGPAGRRGRWASGSWRRSGPPSPRASPRSCPATCGSRPSARPRRR